MVHTHELTFAGPVLTKRYTSWHRGEHDREWTILRHLHHHAPGLAPRPIAADLDTLPPTVTMTVLPGTPLGGVPTPTQLDGLVTAITTLWAVPHDTLPPACRWTDDLSFAGKLITGARPPNGITAAAYDAARTWWHGPDPALLRTTPHMKVVGHRDPNLANYLWDGRQVRVVDFEDAAISDPATELAILVEHLSARHIKSEAFCERFDLDLRRLRAARRLWAMFWLRLLLPGGSAAHRNPPGAADLQARRLLSLLEAA